MPRKTGTIQENNLSKGLITEVNALSFPANASTDLDNVVILKNGTVQRRLGLDFEGISKVSTVVRNSTAITDFVWENVGGNGDLTFLVVQVHNKIYFYEVPVTGAISDNKKSFTYTLVPSDVSVSLGNHRCQYASGNGKLYIFHQYCDPTEITYDATGDDIDAVSVTIKIRDFEGVDDTLGVEDRPSTLTDLHEYNLYNQGWYHGSQSGDGTHPSFDNSIDTWRDLRAVDPDDYPSNADIWWAFKGATTGFMETGPIKNFDLGNTPAPKGHFILEAFDTNRSAKPDIGTVTETTSNFFRPRTGAFFAGRVWYAGVDAPGYLNKIYYSQILEEDIQVGACYQRNDPTAEVAFDLIASDGGVVSILDAGTIEKVVAMQDSLLVFANNGLWALSGSKGVGFSADDFSIRKVSGVGCLSADSIVMAEGTPFWWNIDGIWVAVPDSGGSINVQSLTVETIQGFYNDIHPVCKDAAKGAYDPAGKLIQWVYRSTAPSGNEQRYNYDRVLVFNTSLQCFYTYSFGINTVTATEYGPFINGIVSAINANGNSVVRFHYLMSFYQGSGNNYSIGWGHEDDDTYTDWASVAAPMVPIDYDSYFLTGFKILGDANKDFQNNYFTIYLNNLSDDSSLFVKGLWDFTSTDVSRFSAEQQCYRLSDGFWVSHRRMKVRGHGKALQLRFYSESGKPFFWLGWNIEVSVNASP